MTDILLSKITKGEVDLKCFKTWLLSKDTNIELNCSQSAFITYFLNFIHEEISGNNNKFKDSLNCTPQKIKPPKSSENERQRFSITDKSTTPINRSLEKRFSEVSMEGKSSTPKILKVQSDSDMNTSSNISQISPVYRNKHTPRSQKQNSSQKSSICLGDFIISKKSSSKKEGKRYSGDSSEETSRRITPTQAKPCDSSRNSLNSFSSFNLTKEVSEDSPIKCNNKLTKDPLKVMSRSVGENCVSKCESVIKPTTVLPDLNKVTLKSHLDNLVAVYVMILENDLALNITSEIHFLICLLTKKYSTDFTNDSHIGINFLSAEEKSELDMSDRFLRECLDLFASTHHVLYFTLSCLESQLKVLSHYDRQTLRLLSLNERLRAYSPKFAAQLNEISEAKSDRVVEVSSQPALINVCFDLDTDNRDNFPTCSSFHSFRKQRDLYYEIFRIWETNHELDKWDFSIGLGGRIKALFNMDSEPANFMHFSRLFKAQLLSTSQASRKEQGLCEKRQPFLSALPSIDKDKLDRLKNRLVEKNVCSGLNSPPQFSGYQTFFRDFVLEAKNHCFNGHLRDALVYEIVELNNHKFGCVDPEGSENQADSTTRKTFFSTLKKLRVLAKFLGFIESLPYKSDTSNFPQYLLNSHLQVRSQSAPTFDIRQCLSTSITQNTVVLTIPWLVKYLAMLDHVTLRLPYYTSTYRVLFKLHRHYRGAEHNVALVKFSLGWLFELSHFPDGEYFNFRDRDDATFEPRDSLDEMNVVDQNILYYCCPYLTRIKELLASRSTQSTVTVKHITPVTAHESTEGLMKRKSEQMLEEAFFNGQPVSVRKTVDFVSERIASACVKHICYAIVPDFKKTAMEEFRLFLEAWTKNFQGLSPTKAKIQKIQLGSQVTQTVSNQHAALLAKIQAELPAILRRKIPQAVESLLAMDTLSLTKTTCVSISARICKERVKQWTNSHVTTAIFAKDFDNEVQKVLGGHGAKPAKEKPVFVLPPAGNRESHDEECLSGFHVVEKLQSVAVGIVENATGVSGESVNKVLGDVLASFRGRCDVNDVLKASVSTLLLDTYLLLAIHEPGVDLEGGLLRGFMEVWRCCRCSQELFNGLLCERNFSLMTRAKHEKLTWSCFAKFVVVLLTENLLSCDSFERQCSHFFSKRWDQVHVAKVSGFVEEIVDMLKKSETEKFVLFSERLLKFRT